MHKSIEKHQFSISIAVATTVILFLLGLTIGVTRRQANVEGELINIDVKIEHIAGKYTGIREEVELLKSQGQGREIQLAEMNIKLANIEMIVIDIKESLK